MAVGIYGIFDSNDKPNFSKHVKNCFANPDSLGKMRTKWDCLICDKFFVKKILTKQLDHTLKNRVKNFQK